MKTIRYAFWAIVAVCLILVGLANTEPVMLRAMPQALAALFGIQPDIELPLFFVIFLGVGGGLLIGFLWEWVREHRIRAESRKSRREVDNLRREVASLKSANGAPDTGDDVLALLDGPRR